MENRPAAERPRYRAAQPARQAGRVLPRRADCRTQELGRRSQRVARLGAQPAWRQACAARDPAARLVIPRAAHAPVQERTGSGWATQSCARSARMRVGHGIGARARDMWPTHCMHAPIQSGAIDQVSA